MWACICKMARMVETLDAKGVSISVFRNFLTREILEDDVVKRALRKI